jgi:hypothetical protein
MSLLFHADQSFFFFVFFFNNRDFYVSFHLIERPHLIRAYDSLHHHHAPTINFMKELIAHKGAGK